MVLNPNQWHVKFYFWCLEVGDAFLDTYTDDRSESNLCQYIRTIFVWMPLALVANVGFWLYALFVLIYLPLTAFGVVGTVTGYVTVALVVGAIWRYFYVKKMQAERRLKQRWATDFAYVEEEEKDPSFIKVIWLYLVAMKQKVCPTIKFSAGRTKEGV